MEYHSVSFDTDQRGRVQPAASCCGGHPACIASFPGLLHLHILQYGKIDQNWWCRRPGNEATSMLGILG